MGELCGIVGLFEENIADSMWGLPWGGYFYNRDGEKIRGRLMDYIGSSTIEGTISDKELRFLKTYDKIYFEGTMFDYEFKEKTKDGIWIGKCVSHKDNRERKVICELNSMLKDVEMNSLGTVNEWGKLFKYCPCSEGFIAESLVPKSEEEIDVKDPYYNQ